jgi:hypothetical protein
MEPGKLEKKPGEKLQDFIIKRIHLYWMSAILLFQKLLTESMA